MPPPALRATSLGEVGGVIFFDLDETLYSPQLRVVQRVDTRINRYLAERVGIHENRVDEIRRGYWAEFGTTLAGLIAHHAVDPDDYLAFIHEIELDDVLGPDEPLAALLAEIPGRKAILTNASHRHAARVLERLGIAVAFEAVVALEDLGYVSKPAPAAFDRALAKVGVRAADATLIDDNAANVRAAKALGMRTIWVGEGAFDGADAVVANVHELRGLLVGKASRPSGLLDARPI